MAPVVDALKSPPTWGSWRWNVETNLKSSQVTMSGVFEPEKLVECVCKRTKKHALVVNPQPEKKEEERAKEGVKKDDGGEKGEVAPEEKKDGDGEAIAAAPAAVEGEDENATVVDMKKTLSSRRTGRQGSSLSLG